MLKPAIAASDDNPPSLDEPFEIWGTIVVEAVYSFGESNATATPIIIQIITDKMIVFRPSQIVLARAISHDPKLAAQVAQKAQQLLQSYITTFKIEKASAQLKFIEERYIDNKKEFEDAQATLASFRDRNKNITSARARTQEERLQSEFQLAFEVYSGLAQQMEQARIQVKEETPVFSIIKPVTVPLEKTKPNRPMILIIWTFLGGVIGIGWIFGKQFLATIKIKWKEEK